MGSSTRRDQAEMRRQARLVQAASPAPAEGADTTAAGATLADGSFVAYGQVGITPVAGGVFRVKSGPKDPKDGS